MAHPADADVIRAIHRDAMPGQRAIGGGELLAARARIGALRLHLNIDRGALANRQADFRARFIGEPFLSCSNLEATRAQAGLLKAPGAVRFDRARFSFVDVLDCHRDIGKGRAGLVHHHAGKARTGFVHRHGGKARSRLGPRRERSHRKPQK